MSDPGQVNRYDRIELRKCVLDDFYMIITERDWSMATIPELVGNIVTMDHIPLRLELERLGGVVDRFAAAHPHTETTEIRTFYHNFKCRLEQHLD